MGTERDGIIAEAERVAAGERDAVERVGAVLLERGRGVVGGRAEALLGVGEEAVEQLRRVARVHHFGSNPSSPNSDASTTTIFSPHSLCLLRRRHRRGSSWTWTRETRWSGSEFAGLLLLLC
ncbi:hypothetical protein [Oryza sativa Japonica Group]|uniref:Uncharacterized protein n=3 Tax=Oryza sativa TaxID=4530 RepID=A0A9K3Y6Z0_ORYSJ|nr:hypothetical protein OsI_04023 [Oryza sativa Indica Group]BAD53260.1 hypothetical protein [Oryza sativa Japonica Group]BAS74702.1 Os01g0787201 [Oryza sativa Japonica Group]